MKAGRAVMNGAAFFVGDDMTVRFGGQLTLKHDSLCASRLNLDHGC